MNCQRFEDVVNDIARAQILDVGMRDEALAHARECAHCAVRLEDELAITLRLKHFAGSFQSVGAPARIEAELLKTFEAQRLNVPALPTNSQRHYWLRYGTAAIAALLLIVFALALFRPRQKAITAEGTNSLRAATPTTVHDSNLGPVPVKMPQDAQPQLSVPPKRTLLARHNRPSAK